MTILPAMLIEKQGLKKALFVFTFAGYQILFLCKIYEYFPNLERERKHT